MKIFVYEHIGASLAPEQGSASLQAEGRAMLERVLADLAAVPGVRLQTCLHPKQPRLAMDGLLVRESSPDPIKTVSQAAAGSDACLIIAPESEGALSEICECVLHAGSKLLGPDPAVVRLCSDKLQTASVLSMKAVPTFSYPRLSGAETIVIKPRDGAGSLYTAACDRRDAHAVAREIRRQGFTGELITQPYLSGLVASIALIRHDEGRTIFLPATEQKIAKAEGISKAEGGRRKAEGVEFDWLSYQGGRLPIDDKLDQRAVRLAESVLESVPELHGYVGIDSILGSESDGSEDLILEINPRLTTSYVGYSHFLKGQMGHLLLGRCGSGLEDAEEIGFGLLPLAGEKFRVDLSSPYRLRFFADGSVEWKRTKIEPPPTSEPPCQSLH